MNGLKIKAIDSTRSIRIYSPRVRYVGTFHKLTLMLNNYKRNSSCRKT